MKPRTRLAASVVAPAIAGLALVAAPAEASGASGCPTSYELLSVSALTQLGYQVPALVDDPTSGVRSFGRAGNGNGWVCAIALGNQTWGSGLQVYNFLDDTLRS